MESWKKVCIIVSVYVILREFRPIDPFIIKYLRFLPEKYTIRTLREEVYPMSSYVSVLFIVIIFLITDYLQYKPIIILNGLSGIISYSLLLGSPTIILLKLSQIFLMLFRAAEVAHYTYMFAKIKNKDQYQIAISIVKTSIMIGKCSCGIIAQVLISYNISYEYLLYLSILGMVLTTIWSLIMPPVKFSLYFYKEKESALDLFVNDSKNIIQTKINESTIINLHKKNIKKYFIKMKCSEVIQKLWDDFHVAYTDANVFKWSVWWSLSLSGYVLVSHYIQLHWEEIEAHGERNSLNGAVESLTTLLSAAAIYAFGRVNGEWEKYGDILMALVAMGLGIMLYFLSLTKSLTKSYAYYIIFSCAYQIMATISSSEVAKFLKRNCYALIFGFNKLIAYILIIIFTVIIIEDKLFYSDIHQQFLIYSVYFMFLGCLFSLMAFISFRTATVTNNYRNRILDVYIYNIN
ncbi:thiamine transporter 2-like [Melanaphis sacchari]|uniref:thiamine transporter 2-like n=1 Tax=Melanaphis sacchari TaxID=742174 RepID=UPI000DC13C40|nr:thiamine transporter 2-like [Melanaphis sacchari]